jgi:outer membrane usher protein
MTPRHFWAWVACFVLVLVMLPDASRAADNEERLILSLTVNGRRVDDSTLVLHRVDGFYLPRAALVDARIVVGPQARTIQGPSAEYVALSSLDGVTVELDNAAQDLKLHVDPKMMTTEVVEIAKPFPIIVKPAEFGGFVNYDIVGQAGDDPAYLSGLFEAGAFIGGGTLVTTGLGRAVGTDGHNLLRLDTTYTRDFPDDLLRLRVGDAISRGGDWGRPYRFGGIQIGTDFSVQPGYIPFPLPTFAGQAALPSTVDVFVNNTLRYRGSVDQGPFSLNQIPTVVGGGEARIVLTDPLGRQQSATLPFYVSQQTLREGVSDFSYEAGFLRTGYQISNGGYSDFTLSATHRYGLTDSLTIEGHGESTLSRGTVGGSLTKSFLGIGDVTGEIAAGDGAEGGGWLTGVGFSRTSDWWSVGFRHRWLSSDFDRDRPVLSALGAPERSESIANASVSVTDVGSFSLSLARQTYQDIAAATVGSLYWSRSVTDDTIVSAYALDSRQGAHIATIGLSLTFLFGNSTTGSVETYSRNHVPGGDAEIRQSPGFDSGWGWGAIASRGTPDRIGGDATYRTSAGDLGAAIDHFDGRTDGRITASGGFAIADGKVFVSRRIDDAFGVVSIPGFPDITVMQENRPIGKTDSDGDAFIPKMISHYPNKISVDPSDFSLDADVHEIEQLVTPGYRNAIKITFEARMTTAQLLSLHRADGKPIDTGVLITRVKDGQEFHAGFDGQAYVDGEPDDDFVVDDTAGVCHFRLPERTNIKSASSMACGVGK